MGKLKPIDMKKLERKHFLGGQVWVASEKPVRAGIEARVLVAAFAGYDDAIAWRQEKHPGMELVRAECDRYVWCDKDAVVLLQLVPLIRRVGMLPEEVRRG